MKRAVCVCSRYPLPVNSGGRKRTVRLLEGVQRVGLVPHVLCAEDLTDQRIDDGCRRGWIVEALGPPARTPVRLAIQYGRLAVSLSSPALRRRIQRLSSEGAAFVMYDQIAVADYFGGERSTVPTVLSLHNVDSRVASALARAQPVWSLSSARDWYRWLRIRRVERMAARRADAVLCVSSADQRYFDALGATTVVVPNGVDDEFFDVIDDPGSHEDVLIFAQWGYRPNMNGFRRFVLEGWPSVTRARPQARLRLAGPGSDAAMAKLRALAASADRVEVVGFVEDLPAELARARVVAVPLWQGSGTRLKVLEAMGAARPVIGTSLGVENLGFVAGRHGLIADTPHGLADAVCRVLADPELGRRMGRAGRRHAQGFRWRRSLAPAETLWADLAEAAARGATSG